MAAPRPKKKTVVKKKTDVKSPAETRKSLSRKQVGTNRLQNIINEGAEGRRLPVQEASPKRLTVSQPEKVRINIMDKLLGQDRKGTPNRAVTPRVINQGYTPGSASRAVVPSTATSASAKIGSSAGSKALTLLRGSGILGAIVSPIADAVPAGTGSTVPGQAQKAVEKKMKREIRQGPKLAVTGVKEGTTRRLAPTGSRKPAPGANYSGQEKKIPRKPAPGTNYSGPAKSTYSGYGTFNTTNKKSDAFTLGSGAQTTGAKAQDNVKGKKNGSSQAANIANAGGGSSAAAKRSMSRPKNKFQRESLAMEQRKTPSGTNVSNPKKSILSLFKKRK